MIMDKIDAYLNSLPDWQKQNLSEFRSLIHSTVETIEEDWKWNVPVFLLNGKLMFAMSAFKAHTKYNFIGNGALLDDANKLFNNGLESLKARGIDLREGEKVDAASLRKLVEESYEKFI